MPEEIIGGGTALKHKGQRPAQRGQEHADEKDMYFLQPQALEKPRGDQRQPREVEDILHDQRIDSIRHERALDEPVGQGVDPVSEEIENKTENVEPSAPAKKLGRAVPAGVHDPHAHGEHEGVSHCQIVPEDDIPDQIADILLIPGQMLPQSDGAVA